jgi:hypothetical protein
MSGIQEEPEVMRFRLHLFRLHVFGIEARCRLSARCGQRKFRLLSRYSQSLTPSAPKVGDSAEPVGSVWHRRAGMSVLRKVHGTPHERHQARASAAEYFR